MLVWSATKLLQHRTNIVVSFLAFLHPHGAAGQNVFAPFSSKIRVKLLILQRDLAILSTRTASKRLET